MSGNFSAKHECAGCGDDIHLTSLVRIQCTETSLAFCPECFAAGVEVLGLTAHLGYRLMHNGDLLPLNNDQSVLRTPTSRAWSLDRLWYRQLE